MDITELYTNLQFEDTKAPVTLENILSLQNVVTLQGIACSGKNASLFYLANTWADSTRALAGLDNTDLLLLIQCRYVTVDNLATYLKNVKLPDTLSDWASGDVISLLKETKLHIYVHGYDEAGPKAMGLLDQILDMLPEAKFIIMTRPEFKNDLQNVLRIRLPHQQSKVFTIIGFNDDNKLLYVRKVFISVSSTPLDALDANQEKSLKDLEFMIDTSVILGGLTQIPLTLGLLVILWIKNNEKLTSACTGTDIYNELLKLMLNRMVERLHARPVECRLKANLNKRCDKWVINLGKEAWEALKRDMTCLSDSSTDQLEYRCDELGIDITETFSAILICDACQATHLNSSRVWSFFHKSLQEFLSALFICHSVKHDNIDIVDILTTDKNKLIARDTTPILIFICGLLAASGDMNIDCATSIIKIADLLNEQNDADDHYKLIAKIILESKNDVNILEKVKNKCFNISYVCTDTYNLLRTVFDHTNSYATSDVRIDVGKDRTDLKQVIEVSCNRHVHFRPRLRFISDADLQATAILLTDMAIHRFTQKCALDLKIRNHRAITYLPDFPWYILKDIDNIIKTHPDLDIHQPQNTDIPNNVKYELTRIKSHQVSLGHWLLTNTKCRLSPWVEVSADKGVAPDLMSLLQQHYEASWYFRPQIGGINTLDQLDKLVEFIQGIGPQEQQSYVELRIDIKWQGQGFKRRPGSSSISSILNQYPDLVAVNHHPLHKHFHGLVASNHLSRQQLHEHFHGLDIEISEVKADQWPIALWLINNTKCRFHHYVALHIQDLTPELLSILHRYYSYNFLFSPRYRFNTISDLQSCAQQLCAHILPKHHGSYIHNIAVSVAFSAPLSCPSNTPAPFTPRPLPDALLSLGNIAASVAFSVSLSCPSNTPAPFTPCPESKGYSPYMGDDDRT